jgi:hypothetical protein
MITIFVLATGERLEARRFVLTASNLFVTTDRQQRTIRSICSTSTRQ